MEYHFPDNTNDCNVTYVRNRIENNYFIVYYKNVAQIRLTPKDVGRVFGIAKFTPGVNKIRDWCKEMVAKYDKSQDSTVLIDKEKGFGPECHDMGSDDDNSVSSVSDGEHEGVFTPSPMVI